MNTTGNPTAGVLSEAWNMYLAHWQHLMSISFVVYLLVAVISLVLVLLLSFLGALIAALVSIIGLFWLTGALVEAVQDVRDGRADLSIGDTFGRVQPVLGAIVIAGILAGLGIVLGLVLLIIPGLILLTLWAVIVPVIVVEKTGVFDAFSRSQKLVIPYAMQVFVVVALAFLILIGFGLVLEIILSPLPDSASSFLANLISGTITAPFTALVTTLLYFRLRDAQPGPATGASVPPATP